MPRTSEAGAIQVRFGGLDEPAVPDGPKFLKSATIDHARDGEVMIAYGMNGEHLPMLNGFPLRLVVPGWRGVYWVKMLNNIEVLSKPDTNYWTSTAYRVSDVPNHMVELGDKGFRLVPATGNVPRSLITNVHDGDKLKVGAEMLARGVAFGGDCGAAGVDASIDEGKSWQPTQLSPDQGKYSLREWQTQLTLPATGARTLMVRWGPGQAGDVRLPGVDTLLQHQEGRHRLPTRAQDTEEANESQAPGDQGDTTTAQAYAD